MPGEHNSRSSFDEYDERPLSGQIIVLKTIVRKERLSLRAEGEHLCFQSSFRRSKKYSCQSIGIRMLTLQQKTHPDSIG